MAEPKFQKAYLNLHPSVLMKFLDLEVPEKPMKNKKPITAFEWYYNKISKDIKEAGNYKNDREIKNYIKVLIAYKNYLEKKFKEK